MMDKIKHAQDISDMSIGAFGLSVSIGGLLGIVQVAVSIGVGLCTIIWLAYRIEKLRHQKRNRDSWKE